MGKGLNLRAEPPRMGDQKDSQVHAHRKKLYKK